MAKFTISIPNAKLAEFKLGFLKAYPPDDGFDENTWPKEWAKRKLIHAYKEGKRMIAEEAASPIVVDGIIP